MTDRRSPRSEDIAVVGMACRFPGARNVEEFWNNLVQGKESITHFTDDELRDTEFDFDAVRNQENFVKSRGILEDVDLFDAGFFGFNPREASVLDPQHRIWLECAWEALEDSACDPERFPGSIGVYAGSYVNTYLLYNLCEDRDYIERLVRFRSVDAFQNIVSNDKDYLPSRTSYKFNLRGPSVNVQTACSTSLVAVCQAVQSLLHFESDVCIAGGACITFPQVRGYLYYDGGMVSPDGRCRPFDARAQGTVFSSGVGAVVLKRLDDALADGDQVHAVIRGAALNNDGSMKVSYSAPSVDGQAGVISLAMAAAEVEPETVSYIEAHGTGTPLGDPIEIAGLSKAFRAETEARQFCGVGSVKSNVGHLDSASGVAGLIKTILALRHRLIPPTLHYQSPNPQLKLEDSPFYIVDRLQPWERKGHPLRAGVSSFGVGGTNAHVVLEEAPDSIRSDSAEGPQLLLLSARTDSALDRATRALGVHLESAEGVNLADVAYTLQVGRREFESRRAVVCRGRADAVSSLKGERREGVSSGRFDGGDRSLVFMFPGQGAQHVDMARGIYQSEPVFGEWVDRGSELLVPHLGFDLREVMYPENGQEEASARLTQTSVAQPALFVVEYALARLWMEWGIQPAAMIGHSVGDYVAACLSGVLSLEDALFLIAARGRLMQEQPRGSMLAVRASESDVLPLLTEDVSLAAVNAPFLCVVSGTREAVDRTSRELGDKGIESRLLHTSHAFHSEMMEPAVEPFLEVAGSIPFHPPEVPFISSLTGTWIKDSEATDPAFWARQLREGVRFSPGILELQRQEGRILLEVGPNKTLSTLALQHPNKEAGQTVVSTLGHVAEDLPDKEALLGALGRLWIAGKTPDWHRVHRGARRGKVALPTYPFERKRHWVDPPGPRRDPASRVQSVPPIAGNIHQAGPPETPSIPMEASMPTESRRSRILTRLREIMEELSGIEVGEQEESTSFLELGLDSLFLTQASAEFENQFGIKVTFRQLLEEHVSLGLLADHLDQELPPEAFAAPPAGSDTGQGPATPGLSSDLQGPTVLSGTPMGQAGEAMSLEDLIRAQLSLMTAQLNALEARRETVRGPVSQEGGRMGGGEAAGIMGELRFPDAPARTQGVPSSERFGPYKTIERGVDGELTSVQRKHLDDLVHRYTSKTPGSKRIAQAWRGPLADPRSVAGFRLLWKEMVYQIVSNRSAGARIWDVDGNEYIDITMGFGVNLLGHAPPVMVQAVREQLESGVEIGPQFPLAGEVAELVREFTGMDRVTFTNTGSEAVMAAMRMARTVTGRWRVAYFSGSYHGTFDEVLARPQAREGKLHAVPAAPGIPKRTVEGNLILEYGTPESLAILREFSGELAAVLVEPVQSRHPDIRPREFLREVRRITEENGTALIFDEVITGFRVHPGGAQAWYGIQADIASYGKVVGGGIPIGLVAGKSRFMDALDGGAWEFGDDSLPEADVTFFAGTFIRHPLALAAAKAVLLHLKEQGEGLQADLNEKTRAFADSVNAFLERRGVPIRIRTFSSWFRFDYPNDLTFAQLLFYHMVEKGVYIREAGQNCFFSTEHSQADIDFVREAIEESVLELQAAGFFPAPATDGQEVEIERVRFPLTPAQKEVWVSSQMGPEISCSYNESFTLRFRGRFHVQAMKRALNKVVARHQALRSRFDASGDFQEVLPDLDLEVPFTDLGGLEEEARDSRLSALMEKEAVEPFDLSSGPLLRASIVRLGEDHHWLILTGHHIVMDGWSSNVMVGDLRLLYNEEVEGLPASLPEPMQIQEYARWLEDQKRSPEARDCERYWLDQFREMPPPLELPADQPREAVGSFESLTKRLFIPHDLTRDLKRLGASRGSTFFATLLSAFSAWLYRLSGKDDLVVGVPAAGQSLVGRDDLVGHCVHFLPIRVRLDGGDTFLTALDEIKKAAFGASEHQNFTYGTLVEQLPMNRETRGQALIEAHFNLEKLHHPALGEEGRFSGLDFEADESPKRYATSDVFFNFLETEDGLTLDCRYRSDLFQAATMSGWLEAFETLLHSIAEDPDRSLGDLPVLSSRARDQLLFDWNDTHADWGPGVCIHELFQAQARRTPDSAAVLCGSESLSYRDLEERSNQLARHLQAEGVAPGAVVGVGVDRSLEMLVGVLGILKAGGAYVPLDPEFPLDRLSFMARDAKLEAILAVAETVDRFSFFEGHVLRLDLDWEKVAVQSREAAPASVTPGDLAYVIYTSGSTGVPKGVEVSHGSVVNLLRGIAKTPGIGPEDTCLATTTLSFDVSVPELLGPLTVGGRVLIAQGREATNGKLLRARLDESEANLMMATPASYRMLYDAGWKGKGDFRVLVSGEALAPELADRLARECEEVWNLYGPTEATVWATGWRVPVNTSGAVRIGSPLQNVQVYVLDGNGKLLPPGVPGELYLGGAGVARGYRGRRDLTAEAFVPNPFLDGDSEVMYRTGDLVKHLPGGELEYLGRLDDQVKVNGYRVELGEVETVLASHPAVRQGTVAVKGKERAEARLVGFVVWKEGASATSTEVRQHLRERLPAYMIPGAIVELDAIPLTPTGKVDRNALPDPMHGVGSGQTIVEPTTAEEEVIAGVWRELLGLERIGKHDNFFELGGHSLLAVKAVTEIKERTGSTIPLRSFLLDDLTDMARQYVPGDGKEQVTPGGGGKGPTVGENDHAPDSS